MCAILAIMRFDRRRVEAESVLRMRDSMRHRGPDDAGIFLGHDVALAHRRLSIIDLSEHGKQPLTNEEGTLVLVFNGEIYNYVELRRVLKEHGHRFASSSDSEVIVHQYEEDGPDCVHKFIGMFSFVLFDRKRRVLVAVRDRLGIKPLYYYNDHKQVLFASEVKALLRSNEITVAPDYQGLSDYLYAGRPLGGKTTFRNISEVPPGHMVIVEQETGHIKIQKYWDVPFHYQYGRSASELQEALNQLLDQAVGIHCRSDAPLGCHLSGGLDSSTVTALAAKHYEHLRAFSVKFSDDPYIDETRYAKLVADHVGAQYFECRPSALDLSSHLISLAWHMDIPMVADGFSYFSVSRLAKEHVKVTLTGHGGDEIFGGYPPQFQASFGRTDMFTIKRDPNMASRPSFLSRVLARARHGGWRALVDRLGGRMMPRPVSLEDLWINLHCGPLPTNKAVFHGNFISELHGYSPREEYLQPFRESEKIPTFDRCLYHDLRIYLPSLLHLEDRVSMAVSVESRVPLLDHRVIEFLATVPPEQKIPTLEPKYLLRRAASSLLPAEIWNRKDKFPFPVPGKFWSSDEVKSITDPLLTSRESYSRGIFTRQTLTESSRSKMNGWTWAMVNVHLWFKIFIDKDSNWTDQVRPLYRT
ncbi:MAG: asparagine synthase (glutamine-hydrolyzing) [Nitrospira sp.]|nr:asparagine synthase (glutamine-hydrolyzing) [Nitrospira sp.]